MRLRSGVQGTRSLPTSPTLRCWDLGYDSRVRQTSRIFRFPEETLAILSFFFGRLAYQRYSPDRYAVDFRIVRFVDDTHGSPSQLG